LFCRVKGGTDADDVLQIFNMSCRTLPGNAKSKIPPSEKPARKTDRPFSMDAAWRHSKNFA
jgi:hypothetical protein